MSHPSTRFRFARGAAIPLLAALFLAGAGTPLGGQEKPARTAVGKVLSPDGSILERPAGETKWRVLKQGDPVYSGDTLVGMPGAVIESKDGAVRLSLLADLDDLSPFPGLESAVILDVPGKKHDFAFTLDRGRVDVINQKKAGEARARVRFHEEDWNLTLKEPKTRVAMEMYGRWPRGIYWNKADDPPESPTLALVLVVVDGAVAVHHGNAEHAMHAPPGPAFLQWDSVVGADAPQRLDKLPAWADPDTKPTEVGKRRQANIRKLREGLVAKGLADTIAACLASDDTHVRKTGVVTLGAIDDLPGLIATLDESKHGDTRDDAIMVMRHWIGRGPGQDAKLFAALQKDKKFTPAQADIVLRLLHSFGQKDLARPETYEVLIEFLRHDKLAIRELAEYHIYRLVPEGKKIVYNPAGTKAELETAYKEWKKLVPDGELPKKPKDKPKE